MSVGLKDDLGQIPELVDDFDFAVDEQCAEYELPTSEFCADYRRPRLSSLLKKYERGVWREAC